MTSVIFISIDHIAPYNDDGMSHDLCVIFISIDDRIAPYNDDGMSHNLCVIFVLFLYIDIE